MRRRVLSSFILIFIAFAFPANAIDPADTLDYATSLNDWSGFDDTVAAAKEAMMGDPDEAYTLARKAESLIPAKAGTDLKTISVATLLWLQAEALNRSNEPEKAEPLAGRALALLEGQSPEDTLLGDLLLVQGRIAQNLGNVQKAHESYLAAYEDYRQHNAARNQGIALQKLGDLYRAAHDFERAISYYDQALEIHDADPAFSMVMHNNRANALRGLKRYPEAERHYQTALGLAEQFSSPMLNARILNNIALTQSLDEDLDAADATADAGLAQVTDGATTEWEPFLWGVKAKVAFDRNNLSLARRLIEKSFRGQELNSTTMPYRELHQFAYEIYHESGDDREAIAHLSAFKRLEDEALGLAASANAALMAARFDFANQELRIEQLRLAQLERDIEITAAKARQRNLLFGSLAMGGLLITAFLLAGYISMRRSRNAIGLVNERLNRSNVQLEKANKAKTEFLATTSHEIRTPLNGILGMSQVILRDTTLNDEMRDKLQLVQSAGNAMKAIVDDLLDVAKIETGNVSTNLEPTDLRVVLGEVSRLWKDSAVAKSLDFEADFASCPERVITDPQRLRQILFNLLSNAVKFTVSGSVKLHAECVGDGSEKMLVVNIADTGIGIPASEFEDIFKPFHQVDGAMTRQFAGTGLGLSICKNFTTALGGELSVESEEGRGSVFCLKIPVQVIGVPERQNAGDFVRDPSGADALTSASLLILQEDFLEKMIFEAYFKGEVERVDVVDTHEAFFEGLKSGSYHFAAACFIDQADFDRVLQAHENTSTRVLVWVDETAGTIKDSDSVYRTGAFTAELILDALEGIYSPTSGLSAS